jgi:D-alanine-D-alanine ligase
MASNNKKHVALILGGLSAEREVSLSSGNAVYKALVELGFHVTKIDMGRDIAVKLAEIKPDIVYNSLHGTYGEDGCLQGLLEIMAIPYTHSGVMASAIAMDKKQAKHIFEAVGIACADGFEATREDILNGRIEEKISRPYVIKPVAEGSSVGVHVIQEGSNKIITETELGRNSRFLVEKFIPGKELSVAVMDSGALGVIELRPMDGFYDYTNKYTDGKTLHIMPAEIPKNIYAQAMHNAYLAHKTLGCRGISRSDFRYDDKGDGKIYMLELNTHPGFTPLSLVPEIAGYKGISFKEMVEYLVNGAKCGA